MPLYHSRRTTENRDPSTGGSTPGGQRPDRPSPPAADLPFQRSILVLLLVGVLAGNAAWLIVDRRPTDMDQGRYMLMVREFADGWQHPDVDALRSVLLGNHPSHPHLVPLLASVPFVLLGRHPDAAYFVNTLFHAGLVILAFLTGRRLGGGAAGVLAAFLAAGLPLLSRFSRFFLLEEAAAFFVFATLYCLMRTERFSRTGWAVLTGLAAGFGLLTKWTVLVFVAPPVVGLAAVAALDRRDAKPLGRLAVLGLAAGVVAGPWYLAHWEELRRFFAYNEEGRLFAGDGPGLSQSWFYLRMLWATAGWPFTLLGLLGVAFAALRRRAEELALLLSILVPVLVFALLISTRDVRHLLPALPAIPVLAAVAVRSLPAAWLRNGLTAAAVLLGCLSAIHTAWGLAGRRSELTLGSRSSLILPEARPPDRRDWRFEELLGEAAEDARASAAGGAPAAVRVIAGNLPFRTNGFAFLAAERFPSLRLIHVPFFIPPGRPEHRHLDVQALLRGGYLLRREGDVNANSNGMFDYSRALSKYLDGALGVEGGLFTLVHATTLPGGHAAEVVRIEPYRCDTALLQFLDWAEEVDRDDPGLSRVVDGCASRPEEQGGIWRELAEARQLAATDPRQERALRGVVERHPDLRWPRRLLAETLRAAGDHVRAAEAYAGIGPGAPYLCSPFLLAGDCRRRAGSVAAAREAYEAAVADAPDCERGHRELARVLQDSGDPEAARREQRKAQLLRQQAQVGANVDSAHFRLLLGDLALGAGETPEARHHYRAALSNDPASRESRRRLLALEGDGSGADRE